ncbi:MAG: hypothetical protein JW928_04260 [Candidatus Aureabacteria bacterium]|nr:hypothetical protein [Candidatus Auribacterota bacterium]
MENIKELFERVEADGKITKEEVRMINEAISADGHLDYEERQLLEKMADKIRRGELEEV